MLSLSPLSIPLHLKLPYCSFSVAVGSCKTGQNLHHSLWLSGESPWSSKSSENLQYQTSPSAHAVPSCTPTGVYQGVPGHYCCVLAFPRAFWRYMITAAIVCIKTTSHQRHCDHSCILVTYHIVKNKMTTTCVEKKNRWSCGNQCM